MRLEQVAEAEEPSRSPLGSCRCVWNSLFLCVGDMSHLDKYMQGKWFVLQLAVWGLRGVTGVILANNPLSGVLILASLCWASPWQALLGTLGAFVSTLAAVITGQDRQDVANGAHGMNGVLVALLMGVFSSAGDWYWWLLLPVVGSVTCVFLYSALSSLLGSCGVPASVFPFNVVTVLYLLCTGPHNPYLPHHRVSPPWEPEPNGTELAALEVTQGVLLGVGQIFACEALGPSLLILGAVVLYSPLLAFHALLGSAIGTLAGLSVAVHHDFLYSGLSGFNAALGCMAVGGLFFTFSWTTHLYAVANAFLSAYADIAFSNLLGSFGLPALSWAATLTTTLLLLLTGNLAKYRIPAQQVMSPEHNLRRRRQCDTEEALGGVNTVM
uniref:Urea transporter n=1 Tax=Tetraodon nigroviridis TaxID=99883 RepID=H3BZS6_TETNG